MSLIEELLKVQKLVRRKVFISYYHKDDQKYRDDLEERFGQECMRMTTSVSISIPINL